MAEPPPLAPEPDAPPGGERPPLIPTEPEATAEPEPPSATPEPVEAAEAEPAPVVTETMAEVYLRQGLRDEALAVYRQLLVSRPDDHARDRIAALEAEMAAPAAIPDEERPSYLAADTGGRSTRAFLADILAAGVGAEGNHQPESQAPEEPTPMETAFGATDSSEMPGAPTRPAADGTSLASVFGDEPPPPPPQPSPTAPPPEQGASEPSRDGVSFDEFFGGSAPPPEDSGGGDAPEEDDQTPPEDDEFKDWLKGLKS